MWTFPRFSASPVARRRFLGLAAVVLLAAFTATSSMAMQAQGAQLFSTDEPVPTMRANGIIKTPTPHQVFQRNANGTADIPVDFEVETPKGPGKVQVVLIGSTYSPPFIDGKLVGVPSGGPYTISVRWVHPNEPDGVQQHLATLGPIYVGDLWVLAGQSNMEGVGDLIDVTPPHPKVSALGMDGTWVQATEPLHWLVDSPDPVHSGDPATRAERAVQQRKTRTKGAGLGLPFAVEMVKATGVPVGLVTAAHGGTSMGQWDPAKKDEGGQSLYGSFLRQIQLAGGRVKGVLWYQGESDSPPEASLIYERVFTDFIKAVRSDLGQEDLPFYYVQIGRFAIAGDSSGWNRVQEVQRSLPDKLANTAVVSVIDLELDDGIHVGTQGLKRTGARLAKIALRHQFGQVGASTPTFDRVALGANNTLDVKFRGVNFENSPAVATLTLLDGGGLQASAGNIVGLRPRTHIGGFSIRQDDGTLIPLIYEAKVGVSPDSVILKLNGPVPPDANLWYGHGYDPYANLTDGADMAVPVFGPIPLNPLLPPSVKTEAKSAEAAPKPIKALVITGDEVKAHDWKATSSALKEILSHDGKIAVDLTTTPGTALTDENLANYDVFVLNYRNTPDGAPETQWSDANKEALMKAVRDDGKGLVSYHFASSAFTSPNWEEYEKALGGWRTQGFHGPPHEFTVKKTDARHAISEGLPDQFDHVVDELYQNSLLPEGAEVLATAYSDPEKPRGTGKDEPVIWVNPYGKGRVFSCVLGHDLAALSDPHVIPWLRRGTAWAATGEVE